jgi:hypothetical protein
MFNLLQWKFERKNHWQCLMGYLGGNDDETYAPLQISGFKDNRHPEDFDGSRVTSIGENVAYWQSHSGDIGHN